MDIRPHLALLVSTGCSTESDGGFLGFTRVYRDHDDELRVERL